MFDTYFDENLEQMMCHAEHNLIIAGKSYGYIFFHTAGQGRNTCGNGKKSALRVGKKRAGVSRFRVQGARCKVQGVLFWILDFGLQILNPKSTIRIPKIFFP